MLQQSALRSHFPAEYQNLQLGGADPHPYLLTLSSKQFLYALEVTAQRGQDFIWGMKQDICQIR